MFEFKTFCFNPFKENTSILWNAEGECIILDPGCAGKEEEATLAGFIEQRQLRPVAVWLTHCHIDHVLGLDFCTNRWKIPYYLHPLEEEQLRAVEVYAPAYGFSQFRMPENKGIYLNEGEISLGNEKFEVLFVPGHSPGHLAFYHSLSGQIWSGDVLFYESIGRTDLPGGNQSILCESIRRKLYTLPEATIVHSGHGPDTRIGHEINHNPWVKL